METSATGRPRYLPLTWHLLVDNFLRFRFQLIILAWVCFFIPTLAIVVSYYSTKPPQSFANAVQSVAPIATPVTFYIAAIVSVWGLWTREGKTSFPSRYHLLPLSTIPLVIITLASQALLCLVAVLVGLIPAMFMGLDLQLAYTLPLYLGVVIFGIQVNWCRTEIRFLVYLAVPLLIGINFATADYYYFNQVINQPIGFTILWWGGSLSILGLTIVGIVVVHSQRQGNFFGFKYFANLLQSQSAKLTSRSANVTPSANPFYLFDNWNSKTAMLATCDLKRIFIPTAVLIFVANLLTFAVIFTFSTGIFVANIGVFLSAAFILVGCLIHAIRSRSPENEIKSHLSILPLSDKALGLSWLFNLCLNYALSIAVLLFSLSPLFLYMLIHYQARFPIGYQLPIRIVVTPLVVIALINTTLTIGRSKIIRKILLAILGIVSIAAFAAIQEMNWLLSGLSVGVSALIAATYFAIAIASFRTRTFVWWTNLGMISICILQLLTGYDLMFGTPIYDTGFFGLIFLPGIPFVLAPLAIYLNRHR